VTDNLSAQPHREEYAVKEVASQAMLTSEEPQHFKPKGLLFAVITAIITLGLTIFGLVWAAQVVSSPVLLTLIFSVALLFLLSLSVVVLLLSGHMPDKTASKLLGGVLHKVPGLGQLAKSLAKKD
jgi:low temperature requirement protein LtrA